MMLEADFCALELPKDWLRLGPLSFSLGSGSRALIGEVEETLAEGDPKPLDELLEERKAFLGRCFEAFEVLEDSVAETGDARVGRLKARYEDDNFQPVAHQEVVLAEGPILCSLRLVGPEERRGREEAFEQIVDSFHSTLGRALARVETFSFLAEGEPALDPEAQSPLRPFPVLCHELSTPRGWGHREEGRTIVLEGQGLELHGRRLLALERESGPWLARALDRMKAQGGRLLGWSRGVVTGTPFTALWVDFGGETWRTAANQQQMVIRLGTTEPIELSLKGSFRHPREVEELLGRLMASLTPLSPEDWQTYPLEDWIDLRLDGPWTCTHPGLYLHPESVLPVLELGKQDDGPPLETLQPSLHEALRQGSGVIPGRDSEQAEMGTFRGREAWYYKADAQFSARGIWISEGRTLVHCLLQSLDSAWADGLFSKILGGLQLSKQGGR